MVMVTTGRMAMTRLACAPLGRVGLFAKPAPHELRREIAARCQAVIEALAD